MNSIKDQLNLEQKDFNRLPQFLNVLTILTYIGSGLAILGGLFMLTGSTFLARLLPSLGVGGFAYGVALLLGAALCIFGAMQMRNLKKTGFFIYVAGELIAPIAASVFIAFSIGTFVIPIIFIVLYAINLKDLK